MARRIMVLAGVGVLLTGYYIFIEDRDDLFLWFGVFMLLVVLAYVFQFQIDQLMIRGVPQRLDPSMSAMLLQTGIHYAILGETERRMMEDRMHRWIVQREFINKGEHEAPEDLKYILAYYAVLYTLHQQDYRYGDLDRVVLYYHPFLSPAIPDDVHIAEVESTDGTLIVSVPHLIKGHLEKGYYNIGAHLMAEAYQKVYIEEEIQWEADIWDQLEAVSGIPLDKIEEVLGLPVTDPWCVAVHHQVTYEHAAIPQVLSRIPQLQSPVSGR